MSLSNSNPLRESCSLFNSFNFDNQFSQTPLAAALEERERERERERGREKRERAEEVAGKRTKVVAVLVADVAAMRPSSLLRSPYHSLSS